VIDYTIEDFAAKGEACDVILNAATPVRALPVRWAAPTSGKPIVTGDHPSEKADDLVFLKGPIEEGALRSAIDRRDPLEQVVEAHGCVDQGHKKGNAVTAVE